MATVHKLFSALCCTAGISVICSGVAVAATSDAQMFAQRVADEGRPGIAALVGAYPVGWTSPVPLPSAMPLLGSTSRAAEHSVEAFYRPADAQSAYNAYVTQLRAAGFAPQAVHAPGFTVGGFVEARSVPFASTFCRGLQGVSIQVPDPKSDDLRVTVLSNDNTPFNPCVPHGGEQLQYPANPLPELVAPAGVTQIRGLGTSANMGVSVVGPMASITSSVILQTASNASAVLNAYAQQFQRAGWHETDAVASKSSAIAAFTTQYQGQSWSATLALSPAGGVHQYSALVNASGKPIAGVSKPPARPLLAVLPRIKKNDTPVVLQLLERELDFDGTQRVAIYLHRAPPQLPANLPLPHGALLGSTLVAPQIATDNGSQPRADLYYTLTQTQLDRYLRTLRQQGWGAQNTFPDVPGGFVFSRQPSYEFCKFGRPGIFVNAVPTSNAVTVAVSPEQLANRCHEFPIPPGPPETTLPRLHAPGTVVSRWTMEGEGNAASFTSTLPPAALLDLFAKQLQQVGWTPGARAANDSVGTQTFSCTQANGHRSQASLSLYRYSSSPSTYGAIIDVTKIP